MTAQDHLSPRARRAGLARLGGALLLALLAAQPGAAFASNRVEKAEKAVSRSPRDTAARAELGQAYLKAGRFASAQAAFEEAVSLGDTSPRTALGLSLAEIANRHERDAVAVLDQHKDALPAADLGLALALAGETGRGVAVLVDAVRSGDASPKLRQNLAYAYALDGRWADARVTMAIDTPPDQIDLRLGQWAAAMKGDGGRERVAGLLGVVPASDAGMPAQLALNGAPTRQLASAEPVAPLAQASAPAPADTPQLDAASKNFVPDDGHELPPVQTANAAPVQVAMADPVPAPAPVEAAPAPADAAPAEATRPARAVRHPRGHASAGTPAPEPQPAVAVNGSHVIQLGSFAVAANAQRAKAKFLASDSTLSGHDITITKVAVNGRTFWRVTASGFDAVAARSTCGSMRSSGGACLAYAAGREKFSVPTHVSGRAFAQAAPKAAAPVKASVKVRTAHAAPKPVAKGALAMVSPVNGK